MTLCLAKRSSLEFLRKASLSQEKLLPATVEDIRSIAPCAADLGRLADVDPALASPSAELMVPTPGKRRALRDATCCVMPAFARPHHVLRRSDGLMASGPELTFLHLADEVDFAELLETGYELCGRYRMDPGDPRGFAAAPQLASVAGLAGFVSTAQGTRGVRTARRALARIRDDARSPMESVLVLLLCLPPREGGYGIPFPRLNHRIDVSGRDRGLSPSRYFLCDAFWPHARIDVEYDSDSEHTGPLRISKDARRRNALTALGVSVITATKQQVFDCDGMDELARSIAKGLGVRLHVGGASWVHMRAELRRSLLGFAFGS